MQSYLAYEVGGWEAPVKARATAVKRKSRKSRPLGQKVAHLSLVMDITIHSWQMSRLEKSPVTSTGCPTF